MAKGYFKSTDIKVFPCTYRDPEFDPESRLNTEANFALLNRYGSGYNHSSYIVSWENNLLKVVIGGYYFEIRTINYSLINEDGKDTCLYIKLFEKDILQGTKTKVLDNLEKNSTSTAKNYNALDIEINNEKYFVGLAYDTAFNTNNFDYCLPIYRNKEVCQESFLPIISALPKDYRGIRVNNLGVWDAALNKGYTNSTATWLNKHIITSNPGLTIAVSKGTTADKEDYVVDFELNLKNKNTVVANINEASKNYGYFPVETVQHSTGKALAVKIPNFDTWRPISVDGQTYLDEVSKNTLDIRGRGDVVVKYSEGIEISSTDSYHESRYTDGIKIGNGIGNAKNLYVPYADSSNKGVSAAYFNEKDNDIIVEPRSTTANRNYGIIIDSQKRLSVNVPWIDYYDEIAAIKERLVALESNDNPIVIPWTSTPKVELWYNGSTQYQVLGQIDEDLSKYIVRVYHYSKDRSGNSSNVSIEPRATNSTVDFKLFSNSSSSDYAEFKLLNTNVNLNTGQIITDILKFNITYTDSLLNKSLSLEVNFNYAKNEVPLPYTSTPTSTLYSIAAGESVPVSYPFRDLSDARIRIFPNINMPVATGENLTIELENEALLASDDNTTWEDRGYSLRLQKQENLVLTPFARVLDETKPSYLEYSINTGSNSNKFGSISLKANVDLNYISNNVQRLSNAEVSVSQTLNANIVQDAPEEYWCTAPAIGQINVGNTQAAIVGDIFTDGLGTESNPYNYYLKDDRVINATSLNCDVEFSPEAAIGCEVTKVQAMSAEYVSVTTMTTLPTNSLINLKVDSTQIFKPGETVTIRFDLCFTYYHKGSNTSKDCIMNVAIPFTYPADPQNIE